MKKVLSFFSLLIFSSLIAFSSNHSQGSGGTPPGFKYTQTYIPIYETPGIDMHTLEAEDSVRDFYKQPFRFGFPFPVQLDFNNSGVWTVLEDGSRMWQLHINCPDAISINLGFSNFHIAPGSKLFVYTPDYQTVLGAFTSENQNPDGLYATEIISTSNVIVEFIEEPNALPSTFNIFRITHGYRNAESYIQKAFGDAGSCNVNVNCPVGDGWQNQKRSVVCLVSGGSEFCTGAVVNNTANDGTPYVLTANHCGPADGTWVFRFNWQSAACPNPSTNPTSQSLTGATQRAANAGSDVLLCQINTAIPANYNVYYSGWNRNNIALDSSVCIHHPSGDIKKISFANTPYISSTYNGAQCWQTGLWSGGGITEPGSSGSPLYDPNKRIIGQLYGGPSSCTTSAANKYDYYGKFSTSWATGTTVATRLREWLDPANTGVTVLDGYDPNAPTIALDAQALSVTSPSGTYCSGNGIIPIVVLRNAGVTALTSCSIQYRIDNNTFSTYNWTGNLTTGSTSSITLPSFNTNKGAHTFTYKVSAPNGGVDGNNSNDSLTASFNVTPPTANAVFPFTEGFQNTTFPPTGWTLNNPNNNYTWTRTTSAGGFGQSTASARCAHNASSNSTGMIDELILPYMNFSGLSTARIRFSVAYARYNAQYFDSLKVMVSSDCGLTWQTLYAKGGSVLATAPDVTSSFTPTSTQWRSDSVVLSAYIGNPFVRIKFVTVSGWGQRLWLDDINLNGLPAAPLSVSLNSFSNPSCFAGNNGVVNINVLGGAPAYSFSWSNGATSEDLTNATAGNYSVTVTDMAGNTASLANINLTNPPAIEISTTPTDAVCNSQSSGSIAASASGVLALLLICGLMAALF